MFDMDTSGSWGLFPVLGYLAACGGVAYTPVPADSEVV